MPRSIAIACVTGALLTGAGCATPTVESLPALEATSRVAGASDSTDDSNSPSTAIDAPAGSSPDDFDTCSQDPATGEWSPECQALLAVLQNGADTNGDGVPDTVAGANPILDTDGDGIPNAIDPDVDGDGVLNGSDVDIDGDGIFNDFDSDMDGDGIDNADDPDRDGDGISDRWDLDKDADGRWDDEDSDSGDEEGENEGEKAERHDNLLDLVEGLRSGNITDQDRGKIASEISARLNAPDGTGQIQTVLTNLHGQATNGRRQLTSLAPPGVDAIDQLQEMLADCLAAQRTSPKQPVPPEKLAIALNDFIARSNAVIALAQSLPTSALKSLNASIKTLRGAFSPARLPSMVAGLKARISAAAIGQPATEGEELGLLVDGSTALGGSFPGADNDSVLSVFDRLRTRANNLQGTQDEKDAKFRKLIGRMQEIAEQDSTETIDDAADEVEAEDDASGGQESA